MRINLHDRIGPFLTRAQPALELCAQVVKESAHDVVTFDFANVVQMSPSFTNALFFNLIHLMTIDELPRRIRIENAAPYILDAINESIARKVEHRAELSSYLTPA